MHQRIRTYSFGNVEHVRLKRLSKFLLVWKLPLLEITFSSYLRVCYEIKKTIIAKLSLPDTPLSGSFCNKLDWQNTQPSFLFVFSYCILNLFDYLFLVGKTVTRCIFSLRHFPFHIQQISSLWISLSHYFLLFLPYEVYPLEFCE